MSTPTAGFTGPQDSFLDECWTCAAPTGSGSLRVHGSTSAASVPVDPERTQDGRVHNSPYATRVYDERTREPAPDDGPLEPVPLASLDPEAFERRKRLLIDVAAAHSGGSVGKHG